LGFKLPVGFSYQHPTTKEWSHHQADPCEEALTAFVKPAAEALPLPRRILEVGFGRGLNTAMSLWWLANQNLNHRVSFLGLEPNPGPLEPWPELPGESQKWFPWWGNLNEAWQWNHRTTGQILALSGIEGLQTMEPGWDWIFLDLFSPNKHGDAWAAPLARRLALVASPQAVLTTYSCARKTRLALAEGGWESEIIRHSHFRDTLRARLCEFNENSA